MIDSTSLKVYGASGTALARRVRAADQFHLAVDAGTNTIVAATLTTGSEGDTS